ncbi:Pre-mRNA-splicing factor CWC26 [Rhypophila sp. PSN 637]
MNSDKAAYLAAHYLTVEKTGKTKKRKRKDKTINDGGLLITEDDEFGWSNNDTGGDQDDDDVPTTIAGTSAEFRRTKKSSWKTVGAPIPTDTKDSRDDDAAAADAILAQVAREKAAAAREADGEDDDDIPMTDADVPMMADGSHAGLQSAKALSAQLAKRQKEERKELERLKAERRAAGDGDGEPEFILRDATGRRVDISMKKAEMRRAEKEAAQKEEAKKQALKGEVQLEMAKQRRELLEDAKLMPLARGKDDEEMNRELRAQERWNDPMAAFLEGDNDPGGGKGTKKPSSKRRPVYKGPAPPNRYGIRPGYRWDGVDRGTGFEAERFKALNRRERNKGLEYSWQMDV